MENTKEIVAKATPETKKETPKKETKETKGAKETKVETPKEPKTGKTSIYKKDIYLHEDGTPMTPKEKKSKRKTLRRERDNFIAKFLQCQKDEKKVKELKKAWLEYAKTIYMDLSNIFEANTTLENQSSIKNFLQAMNPQPIKS